MKIEPKEFTRRLERYYSKLADLRRCPGVDPVKNCRSQCIAPDVDGKDAGAYCADTDPFYFGSR